MQREITTTLEKGEGERIEFKSEFTTKQIGKTLSAFANTKGGKIYI